MVKPSAQTESGVESSSSRPPREIVGRLLDGRFRVERALGAGGMGEVYLARQINVERNVAIKVLRRERLGDARAVTRFLREAKTISRLTSPHTVTLHDVGQLAEGDYYIAMEYLEGRTLRDLLDEGPVAPREAARILDQIALSLAEAHAHGIVHRDLKPLNVLLGQARGHAEIVKVVDFGLATLERSVDDSVGGGTPRYMAPEAIRGRRVGPAADVYALGLIAFEMLVGRHPFADRRTGEILRAHLHEDAPPLEDVTGGSGVPRAMRALVGRCLAKPPKLRPRDASGFRRDLRAAFGLAPEDVSSNSAEPSRSRSNDAGATLETEATQPSTMSLTEFERRFTKPSRWRWAAGVAGLALVGVGTHWQRRPSPIPAETTGIEAPAPAPVGEPDRVTVLVHSTPEGANVLLEGEPVGLTPTNVQLPKGPASTVTLRLEGYQRAQLTLSPAPGDKIHEVLEPLPSASEPEPAPVVESESPRRPRPVARPIPSAPPSPSSSGATADSASPPEVDPRDKVDAYLD